jgi:hypothetical protein
MKFTGWVLFFLAIFYFGIPSTMAEIEEFIRPNRTIAAQQKPMDYPKVRYISTEPDLQEERPPWEDPIHDAPRLPRMTSPKLPRIVAPRAEVARINVDPRRPSYEALERNLSRGGDGLPNRFFYTAEQARRLGLKKYTSGPCRNYYQGEEWWCKEN